MATYKGKALVWLHKTDIDDFEYVIHFQSGVHGPQYAWLEEDVCENLSFYGSEAWEPELKRLKPGEWIRFTIKWELVCGMDYSHYDGSYEYYSEVYTTFVRTLRRGQYRDRYKAKQA